MGWKNLRDHYRIEHIVQMRDGKLLIGSPYILDILTVDPTTGTVDWQESLGPSGNEALTRYVREMRLDRAKVVELLAAPDTFTASIPVYTSDGAEIIEKHCEVVGWPNCTHDGVMMWDGGSWSTDKAVVVAHAKRNARAGREMVLERIQRDEAELAKARGYLAEYEANIAKLDADYPTPAKRPSRKRARR